MPATSFSLEVLFLMAGQKLFAYSQNGAALSIRHGQMTANNH